ncbi:hypothetical protein ACF07F_34605 [Streptomyces sp. NPDC015237]|uniref:hypothetical protein n=1 Tax=unclassified Streptomyces TaxID=2593676 RepID=UPI0037006C2A
MDNRQALHLLDKDAQGRVVDRTLTGLPQGTTRVDRGGPLLGHGRPRGRGRADQPDMINMTTCNGRWLLHGL